MKCQSCLDSGRGSNDCLVFAAGFCKASVSSVPHVAFTCCNASIAFKLPVDASCKDKDKTNY